MPKIKKVRKCCRNCEYYDDGTGEKRTAKSGDCHNTLSDRFNPEPDHECECFYLNTTIAEL